MPDEPIAIRTRPRARLTCPRCGSGMIVIGRLTDAEGGPVGFATGSGGARPMGFIKSCYCNDCGEVTLTLG